MSHIGTKTYAQLVSLSALLIGALVWHLVPATASSHTNALWTLAALALTAELLAYLMPREATGSIAFIPYIATVLLVPDASALLAIIGTSVVSQLARKNNALKFFFNCAQVAVT